MGWRIQGGPLVPILTSPSPVPESCFEMVTRKYSTDSTEATAIARGRLCHVHMYVITSQADTS